MTVNATKMNVRPIPTLDERINEIRHLTAEIVNKEILPHENEIWAWRDGRSSDAEIEHGRRLREDIKRKVKKAKLWAPHLPREFGGMGLDVPAARLHERGAVLQPGRRVAVRRRRAELRQPDASSSSTARRSRSEKWLMPLTEGRDGVRLLDDRAAQPRFRPALADDQAPCSTATSG